jgi:hypothetical protein
MVFPNYDGTDSRTKYDSLYSVRFQEYVIVYFYRKCVRELLVVCGLLRCYGVACVSRSVRSSTKTDWKMFSFLCR